MRIIYPAEIEARLHKQPSVIGLVAEFVLHPDVQDGMIIALALTITALALWSSL